MCDITEKQKDKKSRAGAFFKILLAVVCLLLFQQLASFAGGWVATLFSYYKVDPDNTFMSITVHHVVQGILALIAILVIWKVKKYDFGFKIGNAKVGLKYLAFFAWVF